MITNFRIFFFEIIFGHPTWLIGFRSPVKTFPSHGGVEKQKKKTLARFWGRLSCQQYWDVTCLWLYRESHGAHKPQRRTYRLTIWAFSIYTCEPVSPLLTVSAVQTIRNGGKVSSLFFFFELLCLEYIYQCVYLRYKYIYIYMYIYIYIYKMCGHLT